MSVFNKHYAEFYDHLYHDKDYEKECDFIETAFNKYGCRVKTILDLGCGTGGHALILNERGYHIVGVDRSREMIRLARRKLKDKKKKPTVEFIQGDITDINLNQKFDAVISMFAVMGYQTANPALAGACSVAASHLATGGLFIFDCWYGPAVLTEKPGMRIREAVSNDHEKIIRFTEPVIDTFAHTVETRFKAWKIKGNRLISETRESHLMRFLFPQEIRYYLETAGFRDIRLCPFLELEKQLTEHDWNMAVIARR